MWFSLAKMALKTGTHIYKKKQETKMLMADAQMNHAQKMSQGDIEYSGKLLEARQSDWKDEAVLIILSAPIAILAYAVWSDDPSVMDRVNIFFDHFANLPGQSRSCGGWVHVSFNEQGSNRKQVLTYNGKKFENGLPDMKWEKGKVVG